MKYAKGEQQTILEYLCNKPINSIFIHGNNKIISPNNLKLLMQWNTYLSSLKRWCFLEETRDEPKQDLLTQPTLVQEQNVAPKPYMKGLIGWW